MERDSERCERMWLTGGVVILIGVFWSTGERGPPHLPLDATEEMLVRVGADVRNVCVSVRSYPPLPPADGRTVDVNQKD